MSDLEHRAWAREQRDQYTRVQLPVPFLDGHEYCSSHGTGPVAPEELDRQLLWAWAGAPDSPCCNSVMLACRVDLLPALAEYAEQCAVQWVGCRDSLQVSAADVLATHVRHTISRESQ